MGHQISNYEKVLTIRLDGRINSQEFLQDLRDQLERQTDKQFVILDTTLASGFDQFLKSMLFRALQHHAVGVVGICGVNPEVEQDIQDLVVVLSRVRKVVVAQTEADLQTEFGLVAPPPEQHKFGGMLTYLKKP